MLNIYFLSWLFNFISFNSILTFISSLTLHSFVFFSPILYFYHFDFSLLLYITSYYIYIILHYVVSIEFYSLPIYQYTNLNFAISQSYRSHEYSFILLLLFYSILLSFILSFYSSTLSWSSSMLEILLRVALPVIRIGK